MKRWILAAALCLLPLAAVAAEDEDGLSDSDWTYLAKFGVHVDHTAIREFDLWQKIHLHMLINDPSIQNRDGEIDYYLDFIARCAQSLDRAGVNPASCDSAPPGHP
jgi:hypothetical protein